MTARTSTHAAICQPSSRGDAVVMAETSKTQRVQEVGYETLAEGAVQVLQDPGLAVE